MPSISSWSAELRVKAERHPGERFSIDVTLDEHQLALRLVVAPRAGRSETEIEIEGPADSIRRFRKENVDEEWQWIMPI